MERVVVTGVGVCSPLGSGVGEFWRRLLAGQTGVRGLEGTEAEALGLRVAATVPDEDLEPHLDPKAARRMSRSSRLALVAAREAVRRAGLDAPGVDREEVAVIVGSSIGGYSASEASFRAFYRQESVSPFTIPLSMNVAPAANISIHHGFQGPLLSVDAACASAAHSIGHAFGLIASGAVPVAVTGGADSPFSPAVVRAWRALRVLSDWAGPPEEACRPFSADRSGLVLGEGAGILVLEAERSARARGATILAELVGYGASSDAHHLTQTEAAGPVLAMRRALRQAGVDPGRVDYVNAHATATPLNDRTETRAIREVLGERAPRVPVVGNKAALGHAMGASGALELISVVLSLRDQVVPPTLNCRVPDPECDLDYVTEGCRPCRVEYALSNSFAFGGSNAALLVRAYRPG